MKKKKRKKAHTFCAQAQEFPQRHYGDNLGGHKCIICIIE